MAEFDELVERATVLAGTGRRALLGITGAPGAGKSTVAAALGAALGPERAAVVSMDGFHLADEVLLRLGRRARKGAPDTFDVVGYAVLLQRLRDATETVYAPEFRREWEAAVAGAVEVPPEVPLVITEGNYLLVWPQVRAVLDEVWYVDPPEAVRQQRLVERRLGLGQSETDAVAWAFGSDQANAAVVEASRHLADRIVAGSPAGAGRPPAPAVTAPGASPP